MGARLGGNRGKPSPKNIGGERQSLVVVRVSQKKFSDTNSAWEEKLKPSKHGEKLKAGIGT